MSSSSRTRPVQVARLIAVFAGVMTVACSDTTENTPASPLAGLSQQAAKDSTGVPVPGNPSNTNPGIVKGTVLGPSTPGSGGDTLATAPKVANVVVTAYPVTGGTAGAPTLGPQAASVTTGADGKFTLPSLNAGSYVVTFTPPTSSVYSGVWVTGHISATSATYPWWVVLPKKP